MRGGRASHFWGECSVLSPNPYPAMKTFVCFLLALSFSIPLLAQQEAAAPKFPQEELDKLVAPIALYPDSLIALILPSSTTSSDVVLAARFLSDGGDQAAIDNQPWSDSVKSLAHYPDVVKWMDENLAWTRQMGDVFEAQPADVMSAIQRMRAQARAVGLLTDTPQQKVVMQEEEICIVPAQPDIIYVPRYDPEILWMRRPYYGTFMTFGIGFGVGNWLFYDCDWHDRGIWVHHRTPGWVYRPGWHRPSNEVHVVVGAPWRPDPRRFHPGRPTHAPMPMAVRPRGMDDQRRDFHGRSERDHQNIRPDARSDRFVGPAQGSPRAPQHTVTPPPPVSRPHQAVGPQSQPQRDRHDRNQDHPSAPQVQPTGQPPRDHQLAPQTPRPPSHTPTTTSPTPRMPAAVPAAAPVSRQSAPTPQGAVQGSSHRPTPAATAAPSGGDSDKKQDRHGR